MANHSRRRFVRIGASGLVVALAGCGESEDDGEDGGGQEGGGEGGEGGENGGGEDDGAY